MSFAILFSGNPKPQYYRACSGVHAAVVAARLDGKAYGKVIGIMPHIHKDTNV